MQTGIIYKAVNVLNNKCYIGQTLNFNKRIRSHQIDAFKKNKDTKFYYALRKYGFDNFNWEIIYKDIPKNMLDIAEICAIYSNDSYYIGYNSTHGGESPGKNPEIAMKISNTLMGRKLPLDVKNKISLTLKERNKIFPSPNIGKIPWNKGLTKETNPILKLVSEKCSKTKLQKYKAPIVELICNNCNKVFSIKKSEADKKMRRNKSNKVFCSRYCSNNFNRRRGN